MALSDHGQYSGVVDIARNGIDEVIRLQTQAKQDTELIRQLVEYIEQNTCQHEETHRGGAIWEICDGCNAQWADDRGGKPKFAWAPVVLAARARLEQPCA